MMTLIFDWDNTLVNTIPVIKHSLIETLNEFEHIGNRDEIVASAGIHMSMRDGFPLVFGDNWQNAGKYFYLCYQKNQNLIEKMAGFDELINYLRKNNIQIAINSNKQQDYLESEINKFDLSDLVDIAIGSGTCAKDKPAPDGVYKICNHWNIKASKDIYYIGDSDTDRQTAQNAGISFIGISADNDKLKNLNDLLNIIVKNRLSF